MNQGTSPNSNLPFYVRVRPINTVFKIQSSTKQSGFVYRQMASSAGAARLLMLLQVALLVVSAVLLSGSACHGARDVGLSSPHVDRLPAHGQESPWTEWPTGGGLRGCLAPTTASHALVWRATENPTAVWFPSKQSPPQ
ncbi:uncharacterized protein LOC111257130 [Setaria italica]|uniref:uncharacterized protein LOC111257130 n=1 Tax=Setaria italica TaxID=4555 RepID=UPI000BE555DE|nr:uncharacterized protein LOC111257130 [Setaria italica]